METVTKIKRLLKFAGLGEQGLKSLVAHYKRHNGRRRAVRH